MFSHQEWKAILTKPWLISLEIRRLLLLPYIRAYIAVNGISWKKNWKIYGCPIIQRCLGSTIEIGTGLQLRSFSDSNPLGPYRPVIIATRKPDSEIKIGDNLGLTGGTICAMKSIIIGNRVALGANAIISDTDFHPLDPEYRKIFPNEGISKQIIIEDDVFIGMHCMILKGTQIGKGSVIGAGSVVSGIVPPGVIYAGNPARLIRPLKKDD